MKVPFVVSVILSLAVFHLRSVPALAQPKFPDFGPVDSQIQGWMDGGKYPGMGLWIVSKDGKTLHEHYWGGFDRQTSVMMASSTKWIEAATMMTLVDDGKMKLDAPISTYLPELIGSPQGQNTLRQMFSHTSSLNSVGIDEKQGAATFPTQLAKGTAKVKPGEVFAYGGTALTVGWDAIERVTGMPWHTYFAGRLAKPLGIKGVVTGHDLWTYQHMVGLEIFPRGNAADYMNFLLMLLNDGKFNGQQILSPAAIREMQADQVRGAKVNAGEYPEATLGLKHQGVYGLGEWRLILDDKGEATVLTSPSYAGFFPWIDKKRGVAGVFVGRTNEASGFDGFHESAELVTLVGAALDASQLF